MFYSFNGLFLAHSVSLVFFGLMFLLPTLHQSPSSVAGLSQTLPDCLKDKHYQHLLNISENGLKPINKHHRVVIVGAGMAGLTAGYLLHKANHEVHLPY